MIRHLLSRPDRSFLALAATVLLTQAAAGEDPGQATEKKAPAKPKFEWRQTESSLALLNHGKVVWQHVHDKKLGKPYMRFGLLDGTELTRPCPFPAGYPKSDHTWHRALWWSFKALDGVNFWEENQQGTEPVAFEADTGDDGSATIRLTIAYHLPEKPPVLNEKRVIRVSAPDAEGNYLIDWQATFTPAGQQDVVFNRNSYGGFALRLAAEYCGDDPNGPPAWTFFDSEQQENANGRTARWVAYQGIAQNGQPAGVAIFDHTANARHPSYWQTRSNYPYLNPSFTCKEDYTLPPGKSLTLRYGVFVYQGKADTKRVEREWKAFALESSL